MMKKLRTDISFSDFPLTNGLLADLSEDEFPTRLHSFNYDDVSGAPSVLHLENPDSTYFIYNYRGNASILAEKSRWTCFLHSEMYACIKGRGSVTGGSGIVIERLNYKGMFLVGGPVEKVGRLNYIDGCTDSLLIPPVIKGDPCLNHLHFPKDIQQTQHTHPSMRVGMVIRGEGECITPQGNIPLTPGKVFIIHPEGLHSFNTYTSHMDVIAYHPDSDFGPEHEEHPMINRTIVDGVSAKNIEEIRTKG